MRNVVYLVFFFFVNLSVISQDGASDITFSPSVGADANVSSISIQTDGRIIIGGDFRHYNGSVRNFIARVNSNGSLDTTFNPGTGAENAVSTTAIQNDGKILIGGYFVNFNGSSIKYFARLNSDGSLDSDFNTGLGVNSFVFSNVIQADGKILIGGNFTSYNGVVQNRIARLNADGSIDASFNSGSGANNYIDSIVLQQDGKIIIKGAFTSYNGFSRKNIARLNNDGSLDIAFNPGTGANGAIYSLTSQLDGKIIIGGDFTNFNGLTRNYIAKLNNNGSLDLNFNNVEGPNNIITSCLVQSDGKIVVGGNFTSYNGLLINRIVRLNNDGSVDTSFNSGTGANSNVSAIAIQSDGKILIGGAFVAYNGTLRYKIARIENTILDVNDSLFLDNFCLVYKIDNGLQIKVLKTSIKAIKIFDITGKLILEKDNINSSSTMIENLKNTYPVLILQIKDVNGFIINKKIIY